MKEKIIAALVNAAIGVLTSIATIYLGASTVEVVAAGGAVTGALGQRVADIVSNLIV